MARTKAPITAVSYADTTIAVIGSVEYKTLQAAIDAATEGQQIQLIKSTTESVTIAEDKNITLNIAEGVTLTNIEGSHTITNNGTLTITGTGTIDNISHEKCALWNNGTATLTGNTYNRSQESGSSATESGANSYYTIVNHGTMIINDGTTVTQNGKFSSLLENGWYNGNENTSGKNSVLTIEGGTFTGGLNTIKNDDYGKLTINNGSFTNMAQSALLNWNDATITNGTFTADETSQSVVINGYLATETNMDKGSLNIQGGTYSVGTPEAKSVGVTAISLMGQTEHCGTISISGGTLNGNIKTDAGTKKGGSLTISGEAQVNGKIQNSKFDVVNVNGGTITQGIVNNGPGTISVTNGTVQGGIQNASNGFTYISGGTIDGGVTQALPNAITEISGGTFTNIPEDDDLSQFFTEDSKFETGEDGTITVEPKINPTIEIQNLPSIITVGTTTDFSVHITPNDYDGDNCLVDITYSGENALSRENGGLSLQYEDNTRWHDLLSDTFGPPETGFPLNNNLTSNFKVTGNREGNTTVTLTVRKVERNVNLCSTSQSVQFTAVEPEPTKYTVTVTGGTGSGEYEEGVTVTCVATIPEGKKFDVWEVTGITDAVLENSTLTFAMPANDVTCTATFKDVTPKPEPQPTLKNSWYYTVEECGITLAGLAKRFNIDIKKLMKDNSITELRPLYKGEQILIMDDGTEEIAPPIDYWF